MKNTVKNLLVLLFIALITVPVAISIRDIIKREERENKAKEIIKSELRKDCYIAGDTANNFICDCFIENVIKNNNPYLLLGRYKENPYEFIEKTNTTYYEVCLEESIKARLDGEI